MAKRNPQVNCDSHGCYYNQDRKCFRSGINADKSSCGCYVNKEDVKEWN